MNGLFAFGGEDAAHLDQQLGNFVLDHVAEDIVVDREIDVAEEIAQAGRTSRDKDRLALDVGPDLRLERLGRHEVDSASEQILEVELQVHERVERRGLRKLDEQVDVAVVTRFVTRRRSEKRQRSRAQPPQRFPMCPQDGKNLVPTYLASPSSEV